MTDPILQTKSFHGRSFLVVDPPSLGFPGHSTVCFDEHEPTLDLLKELRETDVFVDIGAQFGSYALPALAMGAYVVAFEPTDYASECLRANAKANGWKHRCEVYRTALYDGSPYPQDLHDEVFGKNYPSDGHNVATLDEFFGTSKHATWIKMDVEGAELGVLHGARETITRCRPTLIIENHEDVDPPGRTIICDFPKRVNSSVEMRKMLDPLGYTVDIVRWDVSRQFWVCRTVA